MPDSPKAKAAFLDRDGVIIEDRGYVFRPADLAFLPGVIEALLRLKGMGYQLILITNQSGVARGYFDESDLSLFHNHLQRALKKAGAPPLDAIYYCPHHPEAKIKAYRQQCDCRKPKPGMLTRAIHEHNIAVDQSFMVGDKARDTEAGRLAGVKTALIGPSERDPLADQSAASLLELIQIPHFLQ